MDGCRGRVSWNVRDGPIVVAARPADTIPDVTGSRRRPRSTGDGCEPIPVRCARGIARAPNRKACARVLTSGFMVPPFRLPHLQLIHVQCSGIYDDGHATAEAHGAHGRRSSAANGHGHTASTCTQRAVWHTDTDTDKRARVHTDGRTPKNWRGLTWGRVAMRTGNGRTHQETTYRASPKRSRVSCVVFISPPTATPTTCTRRARRAGVGTYVCRSDSILFGERDEKKRNKFVNDTIAARLAVLLTSTSNCRHRRDGACTS